MGHADFVENIACDSRGETRNSASSAPPLGDPECGSNSGNSPEISKSGWGGPRANSGGARSGAGRKPKPKLIVYNGPRWYCVQTRPRAELAVIHAIFGLGLEPYCPKFVDGEGQAPRPLFPGYIFVRFDRTEPAWRGIYAIDGAIQVFSTAPEHPTPLRDSVIDALKAQAGADGVINARPAGVKIINEGAGVRITSGPFADMLAFCQRDDGTRISLLLGQFAITLSRESVEEC